MSASDLPTMNLLRKSVRPEFLNRVDETIMFMPLNREDIRKIVDIQFELVQNRLAENGVKITADSNVLDKLAILGYDPQFGARPLKRVLQREVLNPLSKEILAGNIEKDAVVNISLDDMGSIKFENRKEQLAV